MSGPIIKVVDIAWIRLRAPDLERQEQFLADFGMVRSTRTDSAIYMRGTDTSHHIYIAERGEPKVLSIGFAAASKQDLHLLSDKVSGASPVEPLNEPGGGWRVRLKELNGFGIEVVHGVATLAPIAALRASALNTGAEKRRLGSLQRVEIRPSQVKRIGHAVLSTPDVTGSARWMHEHLGLILSEEVHADDDSSKALASFNRVDRGKEYVDHHTMMFALHQRRGLNHVSFEVQDVDDLHAGHDFLGTRGEYRHVWGVGRHLLGSQIFDYWSDPWGRMHEHWTDSDLLNDETPSRRVPRAQGLRSQWGPSAPQEFRDAASE
jgi:catechol 2,3-dioxygenase-like lactoylglutathione lyase family enzyme